MELEYNDMLKAAGLDESQLSSVIKEDYIMMLDLSIVTYPRKKLGRNPETKGGILNMDSNRDLLLIENIDLKNTFIRNILDSENGITSLNTSNFRFNNSKDRIASKDFRVMVEDSTSKLNEYEMLHSISVATLMLCGVIEMPVGNMYLKDRYKKYGRTEIVYSDYGVLHMKIFNNNKIKGMPYSELPRGSSLKLK